MRVSSWLEQQTSLQAPHQRLTCASTCSSAGAAPVDDPPFWRTSSSGGSWGGGTASDAGGGEQRGPSFGLLQGAVVLLLAVTLLGFFHLAPRVNIAAGLRWAQAHSVLGGVCFVLAYTACLVLMLPAAGLSVLGGALFGFYRGAALVWLGSVLGQTLAFWVARYVFRELVSHQLLAKWPRFAHIDRALQHEGWRVICVLRLSPIVPHTVTNYVLGVTAVTLWTYTWSSALYVIPYTVLTVYVGCVSTDVVSLLNGSWAVGGPALLSWGVSSSAVVVVFLLVYGYRVTKRVMHNALMESIGKEALPLNDDAGSAVPCAFGGAERIDRAARQGL